MFGVLKGSRCGLNRKEQSEWMSHICGLCLTLRDKHGQLARLTTGFDTAYLSVLYEAQLPRPVARRSHFCPLRGFSTANVVDSSSLGAQHAAAMSLQMAAAHIDDHLIDGDGYFSKLRVLGKKLVRSWRIGAEGLAQELGYSTKPIEAVVGSQSSLESKRGERFLFYSGPTEFAVAEAFGRLGSLAHMPANTEHLRTLGGMFGRIVYLIDSVQDFKQDASRRKFNPLAQRFDQVEYRREAWKFFSDAHEKLRASFARLILPQPSLAKRLLVDELYRVGSHHILTCSMRAEAKTNYENSAASNQQEKQHPAEWHRMKPRTKKGRKNRDAAGQDKASEHGCCVYSEACCDICCCSCCDACS